MPSPRRGVRRGRILAPLALALAGAAVLVGGPAGPAPGGAADRYRAGEPVTARTEVPAADASAVRARGLAHARALGLPAGAAARLARVDDRFSGTVLDEVVTTDPRGRRLGIVRMDREGRLAMAVRLGWRAPASHPIGATEARTRGAAVAAAAGIAGPGDPAVVPAADGGWRSAWQRFVDGVPVLGDGSTVTLFGDGTFHAAAHRERPLAAAPASTLTAAAAERIATKRLAGLLGAAAGQAQLERARLARVAPNDTFDADRPDAPDAVLRLAWVVEVRTVAPLADRLRALELYLDAGDGTLLGGDLLQ
jgi:hypothetical protein